MPERRLARVRFLGQCALRAALAGILLGALLAVEAAGASAIANPELRRSGAEALALAVTIAATAVGLLGGILGVLVGLFLIVRGRRLISHRLSALSLTVILAILPPGLAVSAVSAVQVGQRSTDTAGLLLLEAVASAIGLAVGLAAAILARRKIGRLVAWLGIWEWRVANFGTPIIVVTLLTSLVITLFPASASSTPAFRLSNAPVKGQALFGASGESHPNVLLITVDTLRADKLGSYGNTVVKTPNMDRLAADGARFQWSFSQQPQTNPQHAAIFTGLYPSTNGLRAHMVDLLSARFPTLAEILRTAGYNTAGIFSWISLEQAFSGFQRGYDDYQGYVVNQSSTLAGGHLQFLASTYRRLTEYLAAVKTADLVLGYSQSIENNIDGRADVTTDAAIDWLRQGHRPFFLWVHYFDPHTPYTPPAPYDRMYDPDYRDTLDGKMDNIRRINDGGAISERDRQHLEALYEGEISFADAQIGRLLAALDNDGLAGNTMVVLTADHGESFAEHNVWFHGGALYNTEVRVPLIVRYPSVVAVGTVVTAPSQGVDVAPTILELLGIHPSMSFQGNSLAPLLSKTDDGAERESFSQLADRRKVAIVRGGWKLILERSSGRSELYDLVKDPNETENVAVRNPAVAHDLEARLRAWMTTQGIGQ